MSEDNTTTATATATTMEAKQNIVMFPLMAQGHIIPFLALALKIEAHRPPTTATITFVTTTSNLPRLRSSLPTHSSLRLRALPFSPAAHGLPPSAENTDGLPYHLIYRLIDAASASLRPHFRDLVSDLTSSSHPTCLISDIFFPWAADVAHEFGASHAVLCGGGGFGFACYYSLWLNLPHVHPKTTRSEDFRLPDFPEAPPIHRTQLAAALLAAGEGDFWTEFQARTLPQWAKSDAILFNTVEEIDRIGLGYFRRKLGLPVWPVGPVLTAPQMKTPGGPELCSCREWLDEKPPSSVLYVSFGSQNAPSASQTMRLAEALEAGGWSFLWVVRRPSGTGIENDGGECGWLPVGFRRRMEDGKRGLLVERWAPQVEILSHPSTAAFLSHGGWNSVLEALSSGVPMIGWPMAAEQFYNVMVLEKELGVCVEVARGSSEEVRSEDIVEKIEMVMGDTGRGTEMRRRAGEARDMIMDAVRDEEEGYKGSSVEAMDDFLNAALPCPMSIT